MDLFVDYVNLKGDEMEAANSTDNLCDSCGSCIADCDGTVEFGDGVGNDNVIKCDTYWEA